MIAVGIPNADRARLLRLATIAVAFGVGWLVYMLAMIVTVYDGCLSLVFQPFVAALCSGLFVAAALILGLLLKIPLVRRWWTSSRLWATGLALASVAVLIAGSLMPGYSIRHPELGHQVHMIHPAIAVSGYFFLLFALANWPLRSSS